MLQGFISDIGHDIHNHSESITASVTCFLLVNNLNWQYEIVRFLLGIVASIFSGYVVNRLKKYWDKPKNKKNGKKN